MSDALEIGPGLAAAQLAATIVFADEGSAASYIMLYSGPGGSGDMLAKVDLAKPCATLVDGALVLHQATSGAIVLISGIPRSARWISGAGMLVVAGTVTDTDHDGSFQVVGSVTTEGETSPMLYAGTAVLLSFSL